LGALLFYFILVWFSLVLKQAPGARRATPRVGGIAILFYFSLV
jgi:hypothetical protein